MSKQIPTPIALNIAKLVVCSVVMAVVGLILGLVGKDSTLLVLSGLVLLAGGAKAFSLFSVGKDKKYEVWEGLVTEDRASPMQRKHVLVMHLDSGEEVSCLVSGKAHLKPQCRYRIYLDRCSAPEQLSALPLRLRPARTILGCELLEEHS